MTAPEDRLWNRLVSALPSDAAEDELAESLRLGDLDADAACRFADDVTWSDAEVDDLIAFVRRREGQTLGLDLARARKRRWRRVAAAALLLGVIGLGTWLLRRSGPADESPRQYFEVALLQLADSRFAGYRAGQLIVQISPVADPVDFGARWKMRPLAEASIDRTFLYEREEAGSVEPLLASLRNDPHVLWAEPNYLVRTTSSLRHPLAVTSKTDVEPGSTEGEPIVVAWVGSPRESVDGRRAARAIHDLSPRSQILWVPVVDERGFGDVFQVVQGLHTAWTRGARVVQIGVSIEAPSELLTQAVLEPVGAGLVVIAGESMFTRDVGAECPVTCGTAAPTLLACDTTTPLVRSLRGSGADVAALAGAAALAFGLHPDGDPARVAACLRQQLELPEACRREPHDLNLQTSLDVVAFSACPDV